jgi:LysM repeat protein
MTRALVFLLLAFSALALIAIACNDDGDFLLEDSPDVTGTPPFNQRSPQPSPTPTDTPAAVLGECGETYTVEAGDSPSAIAAKCGVDVNELLELNDIDDPRSLSVGQELKMPPLQPTPTEDTPTEDTPTEDTPTEDTPTEDTPTEDTPTEDTPTEDTPTGDEG